MFVWESSGDCTWVCSAGDLLVGRVEQPQTRSDDEDGEWESINYSGYAAEAQAAVEAAAATLVQVILSTDDGSAAE